MSTDDGLARVEENVQQRFLIVGYDCHQVLSGNKKLKKVKCFISPRVSDVVMHYMVRHVHASCSSFCSNFKWESIRYFSLSHLECLLVVFVMLPRLAHMHPHSLILKLTHPLSHSLPPPIIFLSLFIVQDRFCTQPIHSWWWCPKPSYINLFIKRSACCYFL